MCLVGVKLPRIERRGAGPARLLQSLLFCTACFALIAAFRPASAAGAALVVMNRTDVDVPLLLTDVDRVERRFTLAPGQLMPIAVTGRVAVSFVSQDETRHYAVAPNRAYSLLNRNGRLDMAMAPLVDGAQAEPTTPEEGRLLPSPEPLVVPVKLLVDDDEPAVRALWEPRLRKRVSEASEILQHHCGAQLKVVAVETWHSDNAIHEFGQSLAEFERNVDPSPGKIAIGFTSQYHLIPKRHTPLGGTRGPLYPWILIREWSQHVTSSERLEVLVHELGHVFGAAHSARSDSVMRPELGDHQSHARSFRIGFDPLNTLAMYLLVDELRRGPLHGYADFRPQTRTALQQIYATLAQSLPDDPAAPKYFELMAQDRPDESKRPPTEQPAP